MSILTAAIIYSLDLTLKLHDMKTPYKLYVPIYVHHINSYPCTVPVLLHHVYAIIGKWLLCQAMDNQIHCFGVLNNFRMNRKKNFKGHMVCDDCVY